MAKTKKIDTAEIVKARRSGMSYIAIAESFGVQKRTVSYHLKKAKFQNGIRYTNNKMRIFSNLKNIKKEYLEGKLSLEKVCIKYGVQRIAVTSIFRKNGIAIRDGETSKAYLRELGLYKQNTFNGVKNPNYRHGKYCGEKRNQPEYHTAEYCSWNRQVLERDKYLCRECGEKNKISTHHIIPRRKDMLRFYDVSNGITLCEKCHQKTYFQEENFADKYFSFIRNTAKAGV